MKRKNNGFTLIELILVIAITVVLAAGAFVALDPIKRIGEASDARKWVAAERFFNGVYKYMVDNNGCFYGVGGGDEEPFFCAAEERFGGNDDGNYSFFIAPHNEQATIYTCPDNTRFEEGGVCGVNECDNDGGGSWRAYTGISYQDSGVDWAKEGFWVHYNTMNALSVGYCSSYSSATGGNPIQIGPFDSSEQQQQ